MTVRNPSEGLSIRAALSQKRPDKVHQHQAGPKPTDHTRIDMACLPDDTFQHILATTKGLNVAQVPIGPRADRVAVIDAGDLSLVAGYRWYYNGRYPYARSGGKIILMHRLILGDDVSECVDHIDGDGLNNQKYNLRPATRDENARNRNSVSGLSRFKGVTRAKKRWRAKITHDKVIHHIGYFACERDAAIAYDNAALRLHGDFARTNADIGLL